MKLPKYREKSEQEAVANDAKIIANLLSRADNPKQYAILSGISGMYVSDGWSTWELRLNPFQLRAILHWDSGADVIVGEVLIKTNNSHRRSWVGHSCWKRRVKWND